jgi:hypothetical protein
MRAIIASLALAFPAHAETTHTWGSPFFASTITLQPTDVEGAVAEVLFDNKTVHADELARFDLTLDGLTVSVEALVGRGLTPDRMTVFPPDGYLAVPPELDVDEDAVGRIVIFQYLGF